MKFVTDNIIAGSAKEIGDIFITEQGAFVYLGPVMSRNVPIGDSYRPLNSDDVVRYTYDGEEHLALFERFEAPKTIIVAKENWVPAPLNLDCSLYESLKVNLCLKSSENLPELTAAIKGGRADSQGDIFVTDEGPQVVLRKTDAGISYRPLQKGETIKYAFSNLADHTVTYSGKWEYPGVLRVYKNDKSRDFIFNTLGLNFTYLKSACVISGLADSIPKKGDTVYDVHGNYYMYLEPSSSGEGHYVQSYIKCQTSTYDRQDFEEHDLDGPIITLTQVLSEPPVRALETETLAKRKELENVKEEIKEAQKSLRTVKGDISSHKAKLEAEIARYPHYEKMIKLLDREPPLYVINTSCLSVEDFDPTKVVFNLETGEVFFDKRYVPYDLEDDEEDADYLAFYSLEDAQTYFLKRIKDLYNSTEPARLATKYEQLELRVPAELSEAIEAKEKEHRAAHIQSLKVRILKVKEELVNLGEKG